MTDVPAEAQPPFALISFGGCGTSYLISQLSKHRKLSHKHTRFPPDVAAGVDVGYLYGCPMNAVISHFSQQEEYKWWNTSHIRNIQSKWKDDPGAREIVGGSLENFVSHGVDFFELEEFFNSWVEWKDRKYPVLYIKYERMFEHVPDIAEFFKVPSLELKPQKRRSDWTEHPLREGLLRMYGRLWDRMQQLPDVYLG